LSRRPLSRAVAFAWAAAALAGAILLPLAGHFAERLPACPWRAATGWPCASCGSGHALRALAAGDLGAALAANALIVAAALAFAGLGLAAGVAELRGRPLAEPRTMPGWARLALPAALAAQWLYLAGSVR
jgi:hypothetical protein